MAQRSKSPSVSESLQVVTEGLKKHAGIIFAVVVVGAVVYSVATVNFMLSQPSDDSYRTTKQSELTSSQFDATTIKKIEALGDRNNPPIPALPANQRNNPFTE